MSVKGNCYNNSPMEGFWSACYAQAGNSGDYRIYRENSRQWAVGTGRFSFPGVAPIAMSIYRDFL